MPPDLPRRRCSSPNDVLADLACFGATLLADLPGTDELLTLAGALGTIVPHRDSGPDGVTVIEDHAATRSGFAAFSHRGLPPHTDRSSLVSPPGLVLTVCGHEPHVGGEALLVDGQAVYQELAAADPVALEALSAPRSALFGGADGHLGSVFSMDGGIVSIRLRLDNLVCFSPAVTPHLPALRAAIDRHTATLPLRTDTGYVINNRRWLHGRCAFQGPRVLYRVTAHPHPGTVSGGFHPAGTLCEHDTDDGWYRWPLPLI